MLNTRQMWEPIIRAAAGKNNQQEVTHKLVRDQDDDKQQAAQQIAAVIENVAGCNAIDVSQIMKAIKVWCSGDDWRSQQGNQLKDVLKLCKELLTMRPSKVSLGDVLKACDNLGEQQNGTRSIPYAIGYATMVAFAGKDVMETLARIGAATEAPAGQKASSSERHRDQHGKERRKRARKSDEPPKDEQRPSQKEKDDRRDQRARDHRNAMHPSAPHKEVTFTCNAPK